jgi:hypothetical protein
MTGLHSISACEETHSATNRQESLMDIAEEVRQRWVSIAVYHVSQQEAFLKSIIPDGWLDAELDSNP